MKKRFNKENVLAHIFNQFYQLETEWGFTSDNGYAQIQGADFQKVIAYGKYEALLDLYDAVLYGNLEG